MDTNTTEKIVYRKADTSDWDICMDLAWRTFEKFEAPVYTPEGVQNFKEFLEDEVLYNMFLNGAYIIYVAEVDGRIVGMISLRDEIHISLLFVEEEYHRRGIGAGLISHLASHMIFETEADRMTVNAAPFAYGFYHRVGFIDTSEERITDGITYTPMVLMF